MLYVDASALVKRYIEEGRLGIKSGKGFYSDYEEDAPTR